MECLHRNYAFNFNANFIATNRGSALIANPAQDGEGNFVSVDGGDKRLLIRANQSPENADEFEVQYYEKANQVIQQRLQYGPGTNTTVTQAMINNENSYFPYYTDCILSVDELAFSARNAMFVYAFNLMRIANYEDAFAGKTDLFDVSITTILAVVLLIFFFLVNLALLIAVIGRGILIWIMMILSPAWVLTELMALFKNNKDMDVFFGGFTAFTKLALMPAAVGLVLSLGFIMFNFLKHIGTLEGLGSGRIQLGSIALLFNPNNPVVAGIGSIFELMLTLFTLAALWLGVFAAFKMTIPGGDKNPILKAINGVESFGKNLGTSVAKAPLDVPFIPMPGGGKVSLTALGMLKDVPQQYMQSKYDPKAQLANIPGLDKYVTGASNKDVVDAMKSAVKGDSAALSKALSQRGTHKQTAEGFQGLLKQLLDENGRVKNPTTATFRVGSESMKIDSEDLQKLIDALKQDKNKSRDQLAKLAYQSNLNATDMTTLVTGSSRLMNVLQDIDKQAANQSSGSGSGNSGGNAANNTTTTQFSIGNMNITAPRGKGKSDMQAVLSQMNKQKVDNLNGADKAKLQNQMKSWFGSETDIVNLLENLNKDASVNQAVKDTINELYDENIFTKPSTP